jgi:Tfp pilus assembly protein PilN
MKWFDLKNKKTVVIIEIGNDWLKVFEGQATKHHVIVNKASFRKLAQINEPIDQAISNLCKELKINKKQVITYIPRHLITVRILELPSTNIREIDAIIKLQIGKQTPYSREEIVYAYKVIDSPREGYTKVMLVIANRAIINERIDLLEKAGIEVETVSFSTEGVSHWFKSVPYSKLRIDDHLPVILVDIDSNFSDFMVFHKKKLIYTKNILIGGNQLENRADGYTNKFIDELKHSWDVFQEEWKGPRPIKIFLSGVTYNILDDVQAVSAKMTFPCEIINVFKDLQMKKRGAFVEEGRLKFLSFSSALGFFIHPRDLEFNLLSQEVLIEKIMEEKRKNLTVVGILFGAVILTLSLLIIIHVDNKNLRLTKVKQQMEKIKEVSGNVEKMRLLINLFQDRIDAKGDPLNILNDIYGVTPDKVYLTEISIQRKGSVSMKGRAVAMSEVFKFVNLLENLPSLQNVQNTYATMNKETKDEYGTDFEITAGYNAESP